MAMELGGGRAELIQALQLACSQNPEELKVGEQQLGVWRTQRGFYSGLAVSPLFCMEYDPYLMYCGFHFPSDRVQRQNSGASSEMDGTNLHQEWSESVLENWSPQVNVLTG